MYNLWINEEMTDVVHHTQSISKSVGTHSALQQYG